MLKPLGIKIHKYSDFISNDKLNSILSSDADGYDESALAGALRFFGIGHLNDISHKEVYSQYYHISYYQSMCHHHKCLMKIIHPYD